MSTQVEHRWRGVRFWLTKTGLADTDGRQSYYVSAQVGEVHYSLGWVSPVPDGWKGTTYAPEPPSGWWTGRVDVGVHRTYLAAVLAMLRHSPRTVAHFGRVPSLPAPSCQEDQP